MFFEMLFAIIISFTLGVLALAAVLGYGVVTGDLKIERTADREARKARKKERQKEEAEQKLLEELSKGKKKKDRITSFQSHDSVALDFLL